MALKEPLSTGKPGSSSKSHTDRGASAGSSVNELLDVSDRREPRKHSLKNSDRAAEMAALSEDPPGSVPCTHMADDDISDRGSRGADISSFGLLRNHKHT